MIEIYVSHHFCCICFTGRTFPKVAYYAQALGSGQLSLFNLLKAYSLYDTVIHYKVIAHSYKLY
jgi:hypothetical protein